MSEAEPVEKISEETIAKLKNEVYEMVNLKLNDYNLLIEEKQEKLNKDFMIIKRNTVDEVLKEVELNN